MTIDAGFVPPEVADERTTLTGFLQRQRDTPALKGADLTLISYGHAR